MSCTRPPLSEIWRLPCFFPPQLLQSLVKDNSTTTGTVFVDGKSVIAVVDDDYVCATLDWWPPEKCDYGTCSWGKASLLNLDLSNEIFLKAIKAFTPLKIRLGGSLQDKLIYETEDHAQPCTPFVNKSSEIFGFAQGCLPLHRWDELNLFFQKSGAKIIFGLNALNGRSISSGSAVGKWDSTNAESFIQYTVKKNYKIQGWEFGNELSGTGVGVRVAADQYSADTISLINLVQDIYKGEEFQPQIIAPGGFFDANWFKEFVSKTPKLNAVTHHIYNLGAGVDQHLVERILDPSYLDGIADTFKQLQSIVKSSQASAWVGESGGAYNSGHDLVSNAFVYSFWYLDQLGMAATYDTKTYCRQTLIGGNYGLLNTQNFVPHPDYYSALLWHQLMGRKVLATSFSGTKKLRAYTHCAKQSKGIAMLLINLDNSTTVQIRPTFNNTSSQQSNHGFLYKRSKLMQLTPEDDIDSRKTRKEYHLTAKDGDLHSQTMLLNGSPLTLTPSGDIPSLVPVNVKLSDPISVAPYSIAFVHLPNVVLPACK
ncbi:Heparanase-like protein 3 [Heracleum sosnowskyi]|uniref:Heparanase-like protein 3 n=1 Tax=Heracleum sosnowskyi TaxID=360622 RepID=A0AAD8JBI0_9APIA|nr:Heparanase-like protein 3 [Heracleum sosnowskyi]